MFMQTVNAKARGGRAWQNCIETPNFPIAFGACIRSNNNTLAVRAFHFTVSTSFLRLRAAFEF
jgi:hypothetical protein|tara:strand:+ start:13921 stop:14109 length:189 start_codon:yes stop_codon:yes gene_type:complete